jgi:MIP family channel proteins
VKRIGEQVIAEFFGTLLFVFIGAGSVVLFGLVVSQQNPTLVAVGLVPIALATGLGMAVLISNTGHISGGHHNPAVTISVWVAGKIEAGRAGLYILAQLLGAAAGAWLLSVIIPKGIWTRTDLGTPEVNAHPFGAFTFSPGRAVFLEAVLTFILVYTVFATAVDERGSFKVISGLPIGLAIGVDILVGGFFTGASMNPARSFGPALVSGTWTDFWVYIVGPITGGILAASVYWFAFLRSRPDDLALEAAAGERVGGEEAVLESVLASEAETAVDEAMLEAGDVPTGNAVADDEAAQAPAAGSGGAEAGEAVADARSGEPGGDTQTREDGEPPAST